MRCFDFFLLPFWQSRNSFGERFLTAQVFYRGGWRKVNSSFKIMSKFEIKEHWSVRLTSQKSCFTSRDMFVGRAFQFGFFTVKTLLSSPGINDGIYVISWTKQCLAWRFLCRWIKVQLHTSAPSWTCVRTAVFVYSF